ncbi:hypothetical protein SLS58_009635 [Diplodia intermedia]|uniref:Uncharacterized protein n=1 Tax=Diplodia intermedia TaxID=856260 RepID=A0ABR3TAY3_9PEZI
MTTVSQGWDFQSTLPCESHWPGGDGRGPTTVTATALLDDGVTSLTVRTVSSLDAINNYGVIVRRQATDGSVPSSAAATATTMSTALSSSSSSSSPTPARTGSDVHQGATATATATATSSSPASAERSAGGGGAGLSTAAKAGIGIGAVLLVASALALGFLVGRRNKQKGGRRRRGGGGGGGAGSPVEHVFSPGGDLKGGPLPRGFGRSEVDGRAQRVELPGVRDAVHELYGDEAAADRGRGR